MARCSTPVRSEQDFSFVRNIIGCDPLAQHSGHHARHRHVTPSRSRLRTLQLVFGSQAVPYTDYVAVEIYALEREAEDFAFPQAAVGGEVDGASY